MAKKIWVDDVRGLLKREHGRGWGIEEQSGRVKLYRRVPGDRKQAVTTDLAWAPGSQSDVVQLVATVRNRMEQLGLGLNEAYTLLHLLQMQGSTVSTGPRLRASTRPIASGQGSSSRLTTLRSVIGSTVLSSCS